MEFFPPIKKAKLDFSRPTFNESNIQLPQMRETLSSLPGNMADDECSTNDSECLHANDSGTENVNVFLRIRPAKEFSSLYEFHHDKVVLLQADQAKTTEKHFTFTSVLNEAVDQVQIYDRIVRPVLSNPFANSGATFASYGVSSSGKTFTILGDSSAGLVPRAITQLFSEFQSSIAEFPCVKIMRDEIKELNDDDVVSEIHALNEFIGECTKLNRGKAVSLKSWSSESICEEHDFQPKDDEEEDELNGIDRVYIWISFVEIYNEKITDLLYNAPTKSTLKTLKIYSNNGHSYIPGLTWLFVNNIESALNVLNLGLNKVSYASTKINDHSSRSHTIFTINMIAENKCGYRYSSFKFCDLAGAERTKKTGNIGDRLKEAGGINNSLLVLGRCLEIVQKNQSKINKKIPDIVVPVRDSKLTLLIQSSLLGHEKFFMIVNLYPISEFLEENINVLNFGSIANQIVVKQAEVRKFKRPSSRYSFLLQNQLNYSLRNTSRNGTIIEEDYLNESDLDISYQLDQMNKEQLKEQVLEKKREIEVIKEIFCKKEQDHVDAEMKLRNEVVKQQSLWSQNLEKRHTEDKALMEKYYEKKMDNLKISYERKLSEAFNEIEKLHRELAKMKKKNRVVDDDEQEQDYEAEEDSSEEELIEIDD